jgi:exopolysaccharide biosynthesis polyprenyl glycosylphosphotransferase
MNKRLKQLILFLGDLAILYFSLYLTLLFRYGTDYNLSIWQKHFLPFTIIYVIWFIIFYINNLYELKLIQDSFNFLNTLFRIVLINILVAVVLFYFIPYFNIAPKRNLFLYFIIFVPLFIFWRYIYGLFIIKIKSTNNVLIIGLNEISYQLGEELLKNPVLDYQLVTVIELKNIEKSPWPNVKFIQSLENIEELIKKEKINTIVVENSLYQEFGKKLYTLLPLAVDIFNIPTFWEKINQEIPVSATDEIWFLENFRGQKKREYEIIKRISDIVFSLIFGLISLIFYPFIILAIKITSEGPIFYQQERVGRNGKIFKIIKFRTMIKEAEKNRVEWTKEKDTRITSVGKFLRKTRLDELPQLLNILRGEMSLIGPRPERPEFIRELLEKIPHYHLRHLIKPGLTGWAQINYPYGSSIEDAEKKLYYDLYYIKNRSLILDLMIILKTISTILYFKGR